MTSSYLLDMVVSILWLGAICYVLCSQIEFLIEKLWSKYNMTSRTKEQVINVASDICYVNEKVYNKAYYNSSIFYGLVKLFTITLPNKLIRTTNIVLNHFKK